MKGEVSGLPFEHALGSPEYDAFWSALQRLLKAGADINAFERRGFYNPLLMDAICGAEHSVQRLIALGADPAVVNKDRGHQLCLVPARRYARYHPPAAGAWR